MLIDDSEIDNFINYKIIEGCYFSENIHIHTSGKSALEFLNNLLKTLNVSSSILPEIIFLDINMPLMDGFQFMDELDRTIGTANYSPQIIFLTTSINPSDTEKANKYKRVIKYVNKPLNEMILASL